MAGFGLAEVQDRLAALDPAPPRPRRWPVALAGVAGVAALAGPWAVDWSDPDMLLGHGMLVLAAHPGDETIGASWLLAQLPEAVLVSDAVGVILWANEPAARLFGAPAEQLRGPLADYPERFGLQPLASC